MNTGELVLGNTWVETTSAGGHSLEFYAERLTDRLVYVGEDVPEPIRAQALAYRESMEKLILDCLKRAIKSDRTTLAAMFERQGHEDVASLIRLTVNSTIK